jgi:16S rRNA (guanine1207-N2)-methyltransferase
VPASHYFDPAPGTPSDPAEVLLALPDVALRLRTDRGVFAHGAVDVGTRLLLLDAPPVPAQGHLLDLGCGYGPIALTMARRCPAATVWAVDVNERARALCADNAARNGCTNVRVVPPEEVPDDVVFAAIRSNPPIKVGKAVLHGLLRTWLPRMSVGGDAVLVVHKHLGADSLQGWLRSEGWRCERLASKQGYRLLQVQRP